MANRYHRITNFFRCLRIHFIVYILYILQRNHCSYSTRLQESGGIFVSLGPGDSDKVAIPPEGLSGDQGRNSYQ